VPLTSSIPKSIHELYRSNKGKSKPRAHDQIVAIALSEARKRVKKI
jgi:hypothetical protein